jgi:antitoxin MazE
MAAAHVALEHSDEVREEQGRIVIEPVRRKSYKLDDLLGGINAKNMQQSIDSGTPVGNEVLKWHAVLSPMRAILFG